MSRIAMVVAALVAVAGATLAVVSYVQGPTGDGQDALVVPFLIFWTVLAVGTVWLLDRAIWLLDRAIRVLRRNFAKPS